MPKSVNCRTTHVMFVDKRVRSHIFVLKGFPEWCVNNHKMYPRLSYISSICCVLNLDYILQRDYNNDI